MGANPEAGGCSEREHLRGPSSWVQRGIGRDVGIIIT